MSTVGIIDIGLGNILSVVNAIEYIEQDYQIIRTKEQLLKSEKIIFPGVGSFFEAVNKLKDHDLLEPLKIDLKNDKPYLGICLGMQVLADFGEEGGGINGLGLIRGKVIRLLETKTIKVPHMGWNQVEHDGVGLFQDVALSSDFYFVHSYHFVVNDDAKTFKVNHGQDFVAYVQKGNLHGVQFHPEKSQSSGLNLLRRFCEE